LTDLLEGLGMELADDLTLARAAALREFDGSPRPAIQWSSIVAFIMPRVSRARKSPDKAFPQVNQETS
jgi:hypothetical protein